MIKTEKNKIFSFIIIFSLVLFALGISIRNICENYALGFKNNINHFFEITYVENTGGAWGTLNNQTLFLIIFAFFVFIFTIFYIYKNIAYKDKFEILSLSFFIGGLIGNTFERIKFGYVIDYFKLSFIDFPVFNFFDCCIVFGVFIFILSGVFKCLKK